MATKFPRGSSHVASLEIGAKVRVLGGPFAGRSGVVSELDGKGGARVTLGLLSARILLENLASSRGSGRPSLKTSHHRLEPRAADDVRESGRRSKKGRSAARKIIP